jgi:hypothetical protein
MPFSLVLKLSDTTPTTSASPTKSLTASTAVFTPSATGSATSGAAEMVVGRLFGWMLVIAGAGIYLS